MKSTTSPTTDLRSARASRRPPGGTEGGRAGPIRRPRGGQPTLLIFTLGAPFESRRRRLLPAGCGAVEERLHRACLDAALEAGRGAGCRLEVSAPTPLDLPADVRRRAQPGHGFGARLCEAVQAARDGSDGPVVVVGSDVPGLSASHVRRALDLMEADPERVVVGPSPDGGFYLLASAEPLDGVLSSVRWCCRETLKSLRRALREAGRDVVLLAPLVDLDRRSDLEHWLAARPSPGSRSWRVLLAVLHTLLAALRRGLGHLVTTLAPRCSPVRVPPLRAPPVPV